MPRQPEEEEENDAEFTILDDAEGISRQSSSSTTTMLERNKHSSRRQASGGGQKVVERPIMPIVDHLTRKTLVDEVVDPETAAFFGVVVPRLSVKEAKTYKYCSQEAKDRAEEARGNRAASAARARSARAKRTYIFLDEESEPDTRPSNSKSKNNNKGKGKAKATIASNSRTTSSKRKSKSKLAWDRDAAWDSDEEALDSSAELESEDGQPIDEDDDEDDEDDEDDGQDLWRSRRSQPKRRKKARSHSVMTISSAGSSNEVIASRPPKKKQRVVADDDEEEEEEEEEEEAEEEEEEEVDELMDSEEEQEELEEGVELVQGSLTQHKTICEICGDPSSSKILEKLKTRRGRKRRLDEFQEDETDRAERLGGWIQCATCCSSSHWGCLPVATRHMFTKMDAELPADERIVKNGILPIRIGIRLAKCVHCDPRSKKAALTCTCYVCDKVKLENPVQEGEEKAFLFRCTSCKRAAHYEHTWRRCEQSGESRLASEARLQVPRLLASSGCASNREQLGLHVADDHLPKIIAWRPTAGAEPEPASYRKESPPYVTDLKREYLVKFKSDGFRHTRWVSHRWLAGRAQALLVTFLSRGSTLRLEDLTGIGAEEGRGLIESVMDPTNEPQDESKHQPPSPDPHARDKIPVEWSRAERLLEVFLLKDDAKVAVDGVKPADDMLQSIDDWERKEGRVLTKDDAEEMASQVGWAYVKCHDLTYSEATYDTPPPQDTELFTAFVEALRDHLWQRTIYIPTLTQTEVAKRERRVRDMETLTAQPDCVAGGKLMDFQLQGLNWLLNKWQHHRSCILADDMGLGKTVQIAALLAYLADSRKIYPCLVVVPNSTLQNWSRELAKWVPQLRVVPYYGEGPSRDIIRKYELLHPGRTQKTSGLKAHVILTTYEGITCRKDFLFLLNVPRWEMLIVDEAQRLKSDASLLFKALNELSVAHRVLLTGTPLNNTVREVLNLLNFLDRDEWSNLPELEAYYAEEGGVQQARFKELREKLALYMLRRRKDEVLQLKQKNEVIVPVTMRPLQKEAYKSVLSKDAGLMEMIAKATRGENTIPKTGHRVKKLRNMIMQLRKVVQHPFLFADLDAEHRPAEEQHRSLVDASAKMTWLQTALPILRRRGHRILIFSQFVIALHLISDFLDGEGIRHLQLDGSTKQADRQKAIDRFNKPDSDVDVFLLSTRAAGVGINLASADTVIIYDLDWNPQQDAQAIARSHRFGQEKKVLVFRLMMAQSIEERMMQISKKKLVLDHLIVQTAGHTEEEDFASIILDGARALFSDEQQQEVTWDHKAVEELIDEVENRPPPVQQENAGFSFAPVFDSRSKKVTELDDAPEQAQAADEADFWADMLKQMQQAERQRELEEHGRGARRRNQPVITYTQPAEDEKTPTKKKKDTSSASDADADFVDLATDQPEDDSASDGVPEEPDVEKHPKKKKRRVDLPSAVSLHPVAETSAVGTAAGPTAVISAAGPAALAVSHAVPPVPRLGSATDPHTNAQAIAASMTAAQQHARPTATLPLPAPTAANLSRNHVADARVNGSSLSQPGLPAPARRRHRLHNASERLSPEGVNLPPVSLGQYHLARLAYVGKISNLAGWNHLSRHMESRALSLEDKYREYREFAQRADDALRAYGSQPLFLVPATIREMEIFFPAAMRRRVEEEDARRASTVVPGASSSRPTNEIPTIAPHARAVGHGLWNAGIADLANGQSLNGIAASNASGAHAAGNASIATATNGHVPQPRPANPGQMSHNAAFGHGLPLPATRGPTSGFHFVRQTSHLSHWTDTASTVANGPSNPNAGAIPPAAQMGCALCQLRAMPNATSHMFNECPALQSPRSIRQVMLAVAQSNEPPSIKQILHNWLIRQLTERFPEDIRRFAAETSAAAAAAATTPAPAVGAARPAPGTPPTASRPQTQPTKRSPRTVTSISGEPTRLTSPRPSSKNPSAEARRLASSASREHSPRSSPKPGRPAGSTSAILASGASIQAPPNPSTASVSMSVAANPSASTSSAPASEAPHPLRPIDPTPQVPATIDSQPKFYYTAAPPAATPAPSSQARSRPTSVNPESIRSATHSRQEGRQRCWMCNAQPKHRVFECPLGSDRELVQFKLAAEPDHPDAALWAMWQQHQGWTNS